MNNETEKITLTTKQQILRLRNILSLISDTSYSFSKINKDYPIDTLDENKGKEILKFYEDLIHDTLRSLEPYRKELSLKS